MRGGCEVRRAVIMGVVAVGLLAARTAAGQVTSSADRGRCELDQLGSLGIVGLACEGCSFGRRVRGFTSARFAAEPRVLTVDDAYTEGDPLRAGDVLVALDGKLITTDAGAAALTALRPGQRVTVRVRREGQTRDLRVVTGDACERGEPFGALPSTPAMPDDPMPSPTEAALLPPELPAPGLPNLSLGFSFQCSHCSFASSPGSGAPGTWSFSEPPELYSVSAGTSAWRAGLRAGDALLEIDGVPLTSEEGGRRFAALRPGEPVVLTVRRDGKTRGVRLVPEPREPVVAPGARLPDVVRFAGSIGEAEVEVRGAPVTVARDPERGELIIRSADVVVRVKVPTGRR